MDDLTILLIVSAIIGALLAWSIGANDVASAFGTSVGSKALTINQALVVAAIFEFSGAFLMGSHVSNTFKHGIVDIDLYENNPEQLMVGMAAAMVGAFSLILLATALCLPVSTTHSIVGSLIGFSLAAKGWSSIKWKPVFVIVSSWVTSPVIAGIVSVILFIATRWGILRSPDAFVRSVQFLPILCALVVGLNVVFIVYNGYIVTDLSFLPFWCVAIIAATAAFVVLVVVWIYSPLIRIWASHVPEDEEDSEKQKHEHEHGQEHEHEHEHEHINVPTPGSTTAAAAFSLDDGKAALTAGSAGDARYGTIEADLEKGKKTGEEHAATIAAVSEIFDPRAERVFMISQVLMAIIGSFAHGANDVANAIGPLAMIVELYQNHNVLSKAPVPWYLLLGGGIGVVVGLATWGYRVMRTIGEGFTNVTPSRGFNMEFGAAMTVLSGSRIGIPLSTTQCKVGSIIGVGLADGAGAVRWKTVGTTAIGWVLTVPIAAGVSAVTYLLLWLAFSDSRFS